MSLLKLACPSCGANFGDNCRHGNRFVCEYCGGTTYVTGVPIEEEAPQDAAPAEGYSTPLCFIDGKVPDNATLNEELDSIMKLQEEFPTSDSIAAELRRVFDGKKEVVTATWQESDYRKMVGKIDLEPGENLLLYKTAALLPMSRLKSGMFLTDKRIGYVAHSHIHSLHYHEVKTFLVEIGYSTSIWWYPNGNEEIFISAYGCDAHELSLLLTYALLRVAESTDRGTVVELQMKG